MDLERSTILAALKAADGNIGRAAKALGASRRTLQNRMRLYGIPRGVAGRRRRPLPYGSISSTSAVIGTAAALVGGVLLHRHLRKG